MRKGIVVEEVVDGCSCSRVIAFKSDIMGEESFHDMTNDSEEVSKGINMNGHCPKCLNPVVYNQYLIVTSSK